MFLTDSAHAERTDARSHLAYHTSCTHMHKVILRVKGPAFCSSQLRQEASHQIARRMEPELGLGGLMDGSIMSARLPKATRKRAGICIRKRAGTVASRRQEGQRLLIHHIYSTKARQRCNDGGMVLRGGLQINKNSPHSASRR